MNISGILQLVIKRFEAELILLSCFFFYGWIGTSISLTLKNQYFLVGQAIWTISAPATVNFDTGRPLDNAAESRTENKI